jgi:very-short-patch-repair endonuclease
MQNQATPNARKFSTLLRRDMTDGERRLWQKLRLAQLGVKFRRQHPFGAYVADFVCLAPPLVIEIDGSQHAAQQAQDLKRDDFFRQRGFDVLRFPANQPFVDLQAMVHAIYNRLMELKTLEKYQPLLPLPRLEESGSARPTCTSFAPVLPLPPLGEGRDGGLPAPVPTSTRMAAP